MFERVSECVRVNSHDFEYLYQGRHWDILNLMSDARVCRRCDLWQSKPGGQWHEMTREERVAYELMSLP